MARPLETALKSVRLPLNYFEGSEIMLAQEDIDPEGKNVLSRFMIPYVSSLLVNRIFRNSYFLKWDDHAGVELVKSAGSPLSLIEVERIINCLVNRGFFDADLWNSDKILTNKFIQDTWRREMKTLKRLTSTINPKYELKGEPELV